MQFSRPYELGTHGKAVVSWQLALRDCLCCRERGLCRILVSGQVEAGDEHFGRAVGGGGVGVPQALFVGHFALARMVSPGSPV